MVKIHNSKGFSLIELIIVVAIIVILAAVGVALYSDYIQRSLIGDKLHGLGSIKVEVSEKNNKWRQ